MNSPTKELKVALTGDVALEVLSAYFREAGYEVYDPAVSTLDDFAPDIVYDVTAHERELAEETPGFYDERMEKLSGCRYSLDGIRAIIEEFAWEEVSRRRPPSKILAVDADNTLWRGIISEDGVGNVRPFGGFHDGLRAMRRDGVVLVLLSKNDAALIERAPLHLEDFAKRKVNWAPKSGNLIEACRELNLGTESAVFLDDNPYERAQMAAHLPEVAVAPWGGWGAPEDEERMTRQLLRRLRTYFFTGVGATEEDRLRATDYARRSEEELSVRRFASREDFLDDLGLWVRPSPATAENLDRLVQMAGKTNQFNVTTRRLDRTEFEKLLADSGKRVIVFRAGDRFGEQGIVCYAVADVAAKRVTDFVMSCRAMGRTLEHFAFGYLERTLGFTPEIDFVPTAKNAPAAAFLALPCEERRKTHFREVQ